MQFPLFRYFISQCNEDLQSINHFNVAVKSNEIRDDADFAEVYLSRINQIDVGQLITALQRFEVKRSMFNNAVKFVEETIVSKREEDQRMLDEDIYKYQLETALSSGDDEEDETSDYDLHKKLVACENIDKNLRNRIKRN